jgi:hypothetical protein
MSHFYTIVLVDGSPETQKEAQALIDPVLAPYSEHIDVPEYEDNCYCVGSLARKDAKEMADLKFGTTIQLSDSFYSRDDIKAMIKEMISLSGEIRKSTDTKERRKIEAKKGEVNDVIDKERSKHYHFEERTKTEEDALKDHTLVNAPDPQCIDCGGAGKIKSTYNPNSRWDWYFIGGRYSGRLDPSYDIELDPNNTVSCHLCGGTGKNEALNHMCYQCGGTGTGISWHPVSPPESNIRPVSDLLALEGADFISIVPYAFAVNDEWYEKGGTWLQENPGWRDEVRQLLEKHQDKTAVVCDLHI